MTPSKIIGIQFSMLSADEIRRSSVVEVTSTENYVNNKPAIGGLFDPRMGVLEPRMICPTDHHNYIDTPGYFGHIELARPVYYIQHVKHIMKILRCVCFKCSRLLIDKDKYSYVLNLDPVKRWDTVFHVASHIKMCGSDNKNGCGCVQPSSITRPRFDTIIAEWKKLGDEPEKPVVKISADIALTILKKITDEDITFMGFSPKFSRPEWMICQVLAVPPPAVRPSVKHDSQQRSEDDLTHILMNILKTNKKLTDLIQQNQSSGKILDDWTEVLQYHVATLVNNNTPNMAPISQRSGRTFKSIVERLNGKSGRVRGNLMGKRVDFSARSVISPDPNLTMKELGVPMKVAMNITYPVVVNKRNMSFLKKLVKNGPEVYPGAKILEKSSGDSISLKYIDRESIVIEEGDIIHRHVIDGDPVLFNRQPTLHRMSMLCFYAKVLEKGDTFRMNLACTAAFNADFDGDEMNMHMPQDEEARVELKHLALTSNHMISPANHSSIMSLFQDSLLGAYLITRPHVQFHTRELMNLIGRFYHKYEPILFENKDALYSSFQLLSEILPPLTMTMKDNFYIQRGRYISGQMDKKILKSNSKGLIQRIVNDYGHKAGSQFIDDIQYIITEYMKKIGYSVGISDLIADPKTNERITSSIKTKIKDVDELIQQVLLNSFENKTGKTTQEKFESDVNSILNKAREDAGNIGQKSLSQDNRFVIMVNAGSKGSNINIAQMISCLGQQNVDGKRIPYGFDYRTLPHFTKYDDSPQARGFVESSFLQGLNPQEMFFHAMGGRVGLIDTAVKSVSKETEIFIIEGSKQSRVQIGVWIDYLMEMYKSQIEYQDEYNMELLHIPHFRKVYVQSMEPNGKMELRQIVSVTRHDPTERVYKVITESGREVIVADSKSLLIWKDNQKEFIETLTHEISVGDYVPTSIETPEPKELCNIIMLNDELFKLNYNNGLFMGLYYSNTEETPGCVIMNYEHKDVRKFITKWFSDRGIDYIVYGNNVMGITNMFNYMTSKFKLLDSFYNAPQQFVQGFLNGYISGCGNILNKTIECNSKSKILLEDINYLLNRVGLFGKIITNTQEDDYTLVIILNNNTELSYQLIHKEKSIQLKEIMSSQIETNYKKVNNVILDKIIEIEEVPRENYSKLYDLTIPYTFNFGLANGLQVRDTSQTGYIQRRLIKSLEDLKVEYDMTVRNNKGKIIQFNYGDDSFDSMCIEKQSIPLSNQSLEELMDHYFVPEKSKKDMLKVVFENEAYNRLNIPLYNSKIEYMYQYIQDMKHKYIENVLKQEDQDTIHTVVNIKRIVENIREQLYLTSSSLVNLTLTEAFELIEDTWKQIENMYYIQENPLFKILFWYSLSPKQLLMKHRFHRQGLIALLQTIKLQYKKSLIQPGEMVGMVAAQSIGEPTTQLTLNTFHHSGISSKSNATRGVPRIEELLSLTENPKSVATTVFLKPEHQYDKQKAQHIGYLLEYTKLKDIVDTVTLCFDPNTPSESLIERDREMMTQFYEFEQMMKETEAVEVTEEDEETKSYWIIRLEFNKEKLLDKNITMDDIHYAIKHMYKDEVECVFSDMNADNLVMRIRAFNNTQSMNIFKNDKNTPIDVTDKLYELKNIQYNLLENLALKGVKNIDNVNMRQVKNQLVMNEDTGEYQSREYWVLDTVGTNLMGVLSLDEVDTTRCYSNSIMEMFNVLGIEATRQAIYNEFVEVLEFGGTYVNSHHLSLLVDRMTSTASMVSCYRHGINKDDIGVLSKASFEETPEMFLKASRHAEMDTMRGVSASVMTGQEGYMGTSSFKLVLDIEKMKQYGDKELKKELNKNTLFDIKDPVEREDMCSIENIQIAGTFIKGGDRDNTTIKDDNEYTIDL